MDNRRSIRVAFGGMAAALMLVTMLLGTLVPMSTYVCPALAGAIAVPVVWELGERTGWMLYAVVSALSLLLAPDKEAALLYILLLGWYPVLRPRVQHIRKKPLRAILKFIIFNAAIFAVYALLLFVFVSPDQQAEAADWTGWLLMGMLALGNVTFFIYDLVLARLPDFYVTKLRPKLFSRTHS